MCHLIWNSCCLDALPENWEQLISGWMEGPHFPLGASAKEICSKPLSQLAAEREDESEARSQARIRLSCGISCPVREPLGFEGMCLHKDHTHKALPSLWLTRIFYFVRWETIGGWWSKRVRSGAAGHAIQSQALFPAHPLYPPSLSSLPFISILPCAATTCWQVGLIISGDVFLLLWLLLILCSWSLYMKAHQCHATERWARLVFPWTVVD